ncbi:MAG: hypothetical protein IPI83_12850 [Sphingomonadales bacterium]|nr:hypothetical protein [Sphingomonadales bacterium]
MPGLLVLAPEPVACECVRRRLDERDLCDVEMILQVEHGIDRESVLVAQSMVRSAFQHILGLSAVLRCFG